MANRYPVYIVSKGRWRNPLTHKALNDMGVPHTMIVEAEQVEAYARAVSCPLLVLPPSYLTDYDTCDEFGGAKPRGPGAARNFAWDHAIQSGARRHWVMDDNLDAFHRLTHNEKYEVFCDSTIRAMEDFVDRYTNVPLAGPNYYSFAKKGDALPPYVLNTRIYSCLLIQNDLPYRWRGRYNEDTDLSLRVLKEGQCTVQFNAFLCGKVTTQRMAGGNTEEFYRKEGTIAKSQMLADMHPDVARVVWRFNRWHHHVDYRPFKGNRPIRRTDITPWPSGVNNYGMKLAGIDKQWAGH